jgi:hypothetical protein
MLRVGVQVSQVPWGFLGSKMNSSAREDLVEVVTIGGRALAPGIDVKRDVLDVIGFTPLIPRATPPGWTLRCLAPDAHQCGASLKATWSPPPETGARDAGRPDRRLATIDLRPFARTPHAAFFNHDHLQPVPRSS